MKDAIQMLPTNLASPKLFFIDQENIFPLVMAFSFLFTLLVASSALSQFLSVFLCPLFSARDCARSVVEVGSAGFAIRLQLVKEIPPSFVEFRAWLSELTNAALFYSRIRAKGTGVFFKSYFFAPLFAALID